VRLLQTKAILPQKQKHSLTSILKMCNITNERFAMVQESKKAQESNRAVDATALSVLIFLDFFLSMGLHTAQPWRSNYST
jgi:hypothetical protein